MTNQDQWLILIEEKEVIVGLSLGQGKVFVGKQRDWGGQDKDDLLAVIDAGLGECLSLSGKDQGPEETIFILSPFWVDEKSEVLETRKQILREVCLNFKISPLGFLVGDEALAQYFKDFISVYLGQDEIRLSLVQGSEVKVREQLKDGIGFEPEELVEKLADFKGETTLPSEMVFWGRLTPEIEKKITSYSWGEKSLFAESPKIKVLNWPEVLDYFAKVITGEFLPKEDKGQVKVKPKEVKPDKKEKEPDFDFVAADVADQITEEGKPPILEREQKSLELGAKEKVLTESKAKEITKKKFPRISFNLSGISLFFKSFFSGTKKKLFLLGLPLALILLLAASWYFSKLTVEIYLTPETIEKEVPVKINLESGKLDFDKGSISVDKEELTLEGEKSEATTGEKLIGEKAKGKVTIFNRTAEVKTFKAGTILTGLGELKFSLDEEVKVASKTPDLTSGVDRWGEGEGSITAAEFGAEYNLAADSIFSIANLSGDDVLVKNKESLSGGTSRQIRAVSKEDKDRLKKDLLEQLRAEAKKKLKENSSQGEILEESLSLAIIGENYSADVDDEEDNLTLDLKVKAGAVKLSQEKLASLAENVLQETVPEDFILSDQSIELKLGIDQVKDQIVSGNLALKGKAYPKINKDEIAKGIVAKTKNQAKKVIRSYPRIYRYQMIQSPSIFKLFPLLPPKAENIKIETGE